MLLSTERDIARHNTLMTAAYLSGTVARPGKTKPRPLREFLIGRSSRPKVQSPEEMAQMLKQLSQQFGGKVRPFHG